MADLFDSVDTVSFEGQGGQAPRPDLAFTARFIPTVDADAALATLSAETPWRHDEIFVHGRRVLQPRLTAWYGDAGARYAYSGVELTPLPWTPLLADLKARLEQASGARFNSLLMNLYRDGRDSVSWHSDAEPELGRNPAIASLSFGAVRKFQLRSRPPLPPARHEVALGHGDLLVMRGATQHEWAHQVPKTAARVGPRINLTFRLVRGAGDLA
jgi:alkylated DNA repair dioxygenase AlkB